MKRSNKDISNLLHSEVKINMLGQGCVEAAGDGGNLTF